MNSKKESSCQGANQKKNDIIITILERKKSQKSDKMYYTVFFSWGKVRFLIRIKVRNRN